MSDVNLRYLLFGEDKSASKAVKGVADEGEKASKAIGSNFSKLGSTVGGETGEIMNRIGDGISSIGERASGIGPKMTAAGIGVAGLGAALSMLGSDNVAADNALKTAVTNAGQSIDDYSDKIDRLVKKNQSMAIGDDETKAALAKLTEQTGDTGKALDHMGLVADYAASKHVSLESAATAVGKMLNGNTKAFKEYGIEVDSTTSAHTKLLKSQSDEETAAQAQKDALTNLHDVQRKVADGSLTGADAQSALKEAQSDATKASETLEKKQAALKLAQDKMTDAVDSTKKGIEELSDKLKGRASDATDTFRGKLDVLKTKAGDWVADMGAKYGPTLQATGAITATVGTITQIYAARQAAAAVATEASTVATNQQSLASKAAAATQWLWNAAMSANPIGLIIIAIIALIALLWQHSETFREIVTAAFHAVQDAAAATWDWIKDHWPLLLAILTGPIGLAVLFIVRHWDQITEAVGNAWTWIRNKAGSIWDTLTAGVTTANRWITGAFTDLIGWLTGLPGRVSRALGGMWDGITAGFKAAINTVIGWWNGLSFKMPEITIAGHTVGGGTVHTPQIPKLARGGVFATAGAAIVGDAGPELLDFPAGARVTPLPGSVAGGSGSFVGEITVVVRSEDGREIDRKLAQVKRETGQKLSFELVAG